EHPALDVQRAVAAELVLEGLGERVDLVLELAALLAALLERLGDPAHRRLDLARPDDDLAAVVDRLRLRRRRVGADVAVVPLFDARPHRFDPVDVELAFVHPERAAQRGYVGALVDVAADLARDRDLVHDLQAVHLGNAIAPGAEAARRLD